MNDAYLLDTNICIYIAKARPPEVRAHFARLQAQQLAMSVITHGELCFGAAKSQARQKAMQALETLATMMHIAPLPLSAVWHYGDIRAQLAQTGQMIGNNDLWIAAHARAEDRILVTNNTKEFKRVAGLRFENWVSPHE